MRYLIFFLLLFLVSSTIVISNAAEETGERKNYYCEREDGYVFKSSTECKLFQRNYKLLEITHEEFLTIKEKEDNTQLYCLGDSAILYGPFKGSPYSYRCSVGGVVIKATELVDGKIKNDVKIKFCKYGEGKTTSIIVDNYDVCHETKDSVCNIIEQGNYDKNYQTSIDRINEVVCSLYIVSDETTNNQNEQTTEEAKVKYCKSYDGKVFERKDDCGDMSEIAYEEYVIGDTLYCKRYDGKVFKRKILDDCGDMSEIAYEEYVKGDTLSELPMCEISSVDGSINTRTACFASITYPSGSVFTGEFRNYRPYGQGTKIYSNGAKYVGQWKHGGRKHGYGTYTYVNGDKYVGEWNRGEITQGTQTWGVNSEFHGDKYVGQFKEDKYHGQGTYTSSDGAKYIGEWKFGTGDGQGTMIFPDGEKYVGGFQNNKFHGQGTYTYADGRTDSGKWENGTLAWGERIRSWNEDRATARNTQTVTKRPKIILSEYDEFAIALGCGIKRKDVDDCVRRWLPATIGSGPLTLEQINEVKKDKEMMGEIVLAISLMKRAQDETHGPTEEEQRQAKEQEQEQAQAQAKGQAQQTEGHYKEQSDGQYVWVDTRSGYEKFTDNFCVGCNATQVYMINRATKRYYQGAPLSGWDKFVLRGGNSRRVIKFYK